MVESMTCTRTLLVILAGEGASTPTSSALGGSTLLPMVGSVRFGRLGLMRMSLEGGKVGLKTINTMNTMNTIRIIIVKVERIK